jgi:hypothetical protein
MFGEFDKVEHLNSLDTRELLMYLKYARKFGGRYSPWCHDEYYSTDEIKDELATREHIPNKQEAKKIRQERAKRGR